MLNRDDFLSIVLPPISGNEQYCALEIKTLTANGKPQVRQKFVSSIKELSSQADEMVSNTGNAFFGLATYGDGKKGRCTINTTMFKSLFVDLDCDANDPKKFVDLPDAIRSLIAFCKITKMPKPYIVSSGVGAHVYWVLEQPIPRTKWKGHATALSALCAEHGFKIDPSVTCDAARVLRIPQTLHVKDPKNPRPVELIKEGELLSLDILDQLLPVEEDVLDVLDGAKRGLDDTTKALIGNMQAKFKLILIKSLDGKGCNQIKYIAEEQPRVQEPLWRAGLSVAIACIDGEKAIHAISKLHPDYSAQSTTQKALATKGPYTCAKFAELNPLGCKKCKLKITSPIQLGKELKEAVEDDNVVEALVATTNKTETFVIPVLPFPYKRGVNGGIYRVTEEGDSELIYRHDFYIVKRLTDPDLGETLLARLHLPQDGMREFMMPLSDVMTPDKFRTLIASKGIAASPNGLKELMNYTLRWVEMLQEATRAEVSHKQFGWLDDGSAIVVGDREIRATEIVYSPPSTPTLPIAPLLSKAGDFHVWKDVINIYGKEGMEDKAFTFFMGFGSLLIKYLNLKGGMINLYSRESGSGKTTVLHAINSIWGMPEELLLSPKDTYNSRLQRIGTMRNLAVTMDEITNMEPAHLSSQIYDITQGRAKNRLRHQDNAERLNNTSWATCLLSTSNRSVRDALMSIKNHPDGELNRVFEMKIKPDPNNDAAWSKAHFSRLYKNYGHAIEPYAQHLIGNLGTILDSTIPTIQARVSNDAHTLNTERYWEMMVTSAIAGGLISKQLGLHDIPINSVYAYAIKLLQDSRYASRESLGENEDFLGGYLQRHFQEILVIKNETPEGMGSHVIREPRGALTVRYEVDTKLIFIVAKSYRDDCAKTQTNVDETLVEYKKSGVFMGIKAKRMLTGTAASASAGVSTYVFDAAKLDYLDDLIDESVGFTPDN